MRSIALKFTFAVLLGFIASLSGEKTERLPFGRWERISQAPIVSPRGGGWESAGTFNPAVIERGGKIIMLYRAQSLVRRVMARSIAVTSRV